ncbi:protein of unknown function [Maridesulfovibrio hydrothermalis AM13 = DSM 14728]|uniref:Uncharacterized protein n=1 Tax=Maridesulfovibrio hydrothermalis AM13 = DSM 14728 TaxID=1121451 RepID=L0RAG3_9BACT|nr:protein of unknown function [Maridesulfovibrio hydrothermalis AM13 = DSM 14728]
MLCPLGCKMDFLKKRHKKQFQKTPKGGYNALKKVLLKNIEKDK